MHGTCGQVPGVSAYLLANRSGRDESRTRDLWTGCETDPVLPMGASLRVLVEWVLANKSIYYWPNRNKLGLVDELSQLYLTMAYNKHCAARFKAMGLWRSVPSWKEEIKRQGNVGNLRAYLRAWAIVSIGKEWGQKENVNKTLTSSRKKRVNGSNDSTAFFRLLLYLESYRQVPSQPNSNIILAACSSSNSKSGPNAPVQPIWHKAHHLHICTSSTAHYSTSAPKHKTSMHTHVLIQIILCSMLILQSRVEYACMLIQESWSRPEGLSSNKRSHSLSFKRNPSVVKSQYVLF